MNAITPLSLEAKQNASRYVRWPVFDLAPGGSSRCWLDRRSGRLLYHPDGVDPNAGDSDARARRQVPQADQIGIE